MRCTIDGVEYGYIPIFKGEPAFLGDGGTNPDFDWTGWRAGEKTKSGHVRVSGRKLGIDPIESWD